MKIFEGNVRKMSLSGYIFSLIQGNCVRNTPISEQGILVLNLFELKLTARLMYCLKSILLLSCIRFFSMQHLYSRFCLFKDYLLTRLWSLLINMKTRKYNGMKRKTFLLLIIAIIALSVYSTYGQTKSDSLKQALQVTTSDSLRVQILASLSEEYQYMDVDVAQAYATELYTLAEKYNWEWAKAFYNKRQAFLYTVKGDYASALKFDNSYWQSVRIMKDSLQQYIALNSIGDDYADLMVYDEAYYYFMQAFKAARKVDDSLYMAISLLNLGHVFKELHQYDLAFNHFNLSRQISKKINDHDGEAFIEHEIGELYMYKKEFGNAREHITIASRIIKARKIKFLEPRSITLFGKLNLEEQYYEDALAYYDTAFQAYSSSRNLWGIAITKLGKAKVFARQNNLSAAKTLVDEAMFTAHLLNANRLEIECNEQLSLLAELRGDFKESLDYFKMYKAQQDSLFNQKIVEKLYQDFRTETETKDSEIAVLSQTQAMQADEIKRQGFIRNILAMSASLTAILLFSVYRSGQRKIKINKLLLEHQEEIKSRTVELEQLNQVKDKFFSIISHDLRSPINALSGILDLMDRGQLKPEEFSQLVKELKIQFSHTKTLINNLLDWALLQMDTLKIQTEKINLHKLVDDNLKLLSSLHLKDIEMINHLPENIYALADPNTINLVFRNLILNSIKFTENGGKIWVDTKEDGNELVISVSDNGVGIAPEVQSLLFEKTSAYTTRGTANEKGTGLGLILCKEFVERNGGKIWVTSEVGKGSTFSFTLKKG